MISERFKKILKITVIPLLSIFIIFYAYYQSRNYLSGPRVNILEPQSGFVSSNEIITIRGKASNIAFINLNGTQIFVNKEGIFSQSLALSNGSNTFKISARDRFGRYKETLVEVFYNKVEKAPYVATGSETDNSGS
jgi:hypothetical protein